MIDRLAAVMGELAHLHLEKSDVLAAELKAKIEGYWQSEETTQAGRDRAAQRNAEPSTLAFYDVQGQVMSLEVERDLLLFLLGEPDAH